MLLSPLCPQVWQALYEQAQKAAVDQPDTPDAPPPTAPAATTLSAAMAAAAAAHACGCTSSYAAAPAATPAAPPAKPAEPTVTKAQVVSKLSEVFALLDSGAAAGQPIPPYVQRAAAAAAAAAAKTSADPTELLAAYNVLASAMKRSFTQEGTARVAGPAPSAVMPAAPQNAGAAVARSRAAQDVSEAIQKMHEKGYKINHIAVRRRPKHAFSSLKDQVKRGSGSGADATPAAAAAATETAGLDTCIAAAAQAHTGAPTKPVADAPAPADKAADAGADGAEYVWVINGSVSCRVRVQPLREGPVSVSPPAPPAPAPVAHLAVAALNADRLVPPALRAIEEDSASDEDTDMVGGVAGGVAGAVPKPPAAPQKEASPPPATGAAALADYRRAPRPVARRWEAAMRGRHPHPYSELRRLVNVEDGGSAAAAKADAGVAAAAAATLAASSQAAAGVVVPPAVTKPEDKQVCVCPRV